MTTEYTEGSLDGIMRKVAGLLANADDPATPPAAAETYRAKADALMFKYKIESLTAPAAKGIDRPVPVWRDIWVCRSGSEWRQFYSGIARAVLAHNECRSSVDYETNPEDGHTWIVYRAVGYASDIAYSEALVQAAIAEFGKRLEPKVDKRETLAANALRMRQGGMERNRIAAMLLGTWNTTNEMKAKTRKVTSLIKEEADRLGDPTLAEQVLGRGTNIKTYRVSYGNAFYSTLLSRIQVRRSAEQLEAHGLVLASAKDAVDEAYYERYPHLRPKATVESSYRTQDKCEKCSRTKSGYCREHQWMKPSTARYRSTPYSTAGARAGANAARSVDLGSVGTGKVQGASARPAIG